MEKKVPNEITKQLRIWQFQAISLRCVHVFLGLIAVVCSLVVAAKINSFSSVYIEWLAVTAAIATGLLSAFDLGLKANRTRAAWRILNAGKLRYESDPDTPISALVDAYEKGESYIGDVKECPQ